MGYFDMTYTEFAAKYGKRPPDIIFKMLKIERDTEIAEAIQQARRDTALSIFKELEEHNAGWDGIMVNSKWTQTIKEHYCAELTDREHE